MSDATRLSETAWPYYVGRALFRALFRSMGLRISGLEHVPAAGPLIVASNHRSHADPPLVGVCLPRPVHYMAKHELFEVPVMGPTIRRTGAFPVTRGRPDRRAIRWALQLLDEGKAVVMFPEGTRSVDGRLGPPELGVALIALKSRAPVLPVAMQGTEHLLPKHSLLPRSHPLTVRFGPPLLFPDLYGRRTSRRELEEAGARLMTALGRLLDEPPDARQRAPGRVAERRPVRQPD